MTFINSVKIATAVGLLMQQTSAFCCPSTAPTKGEANSPYVAMVRSEAPVSTVGEAIETIDGLRKVLEEAYWQLLRADDHAMYAIIATLDPKKVDLCELQLRSLEASLKVVYQNVDKTQQDAMRSMLMTAAKARSAASNLRGLISQMINVPEVFKSTIDMVGLRALADHGTNAMYH